MSAHLSRLAAGLVLLGTVAGTPAAHAAGLSAQEALQQFNVISFGDVETNSDVEGRLFAAGDLKGSSATFNKWNGANAPAPSEYDSVVVGGDITGSHKNINNGGDVNVRGQALAGLNMNGGGTVSQGAATYNAPEGLEAAFQALSIQIDAESHGAGAPDASWGKAKIEADGPGITYFDVSSADWSSWTDAIDVAVLAPDETVIINVEDAGTVDFANWNSIGSAASSSRIIWNFRYATALDISRALYGTVIAPFADVTLSGSPLEGTLVAKSVYATTEFHLRTWDGDLPVPDQTQAPAVPVPAALPLLAGGLGALALVGRRRRRG